MSEESYWTQSARALLSRRRLGGLTGSVAATSALLVACSSGARPSAGSGAAGQTAAGSPKPGGTYSVAIAANAPLDPQLISQQPTELVAGGVMSRPFRYKTGSDPSTILNHDPEGDLAVSAESPDGVTWTLKLRPDAKFHETAPVNGHAVEAEDVKATYTRALSLDRNPNRGALGMIDPSQIQAPDKSTVVFTLKYAYAPFRSILASPSYSWIFPREALAGTYDPSKTVIGSGPFTLDTATPDVEYVLKRNPAWFEKGRPYVDSVRLAVITDTAQQLAQFSSGHLDEVQIPSNDVETMQRDNPKAMLLKSPPSSGANLYFQLGDPASIFLDLRVRQAFSMLLDRDSIAKAIFNNQYVTSLFVPPNLGKWSLRPDQLDVATAPFYKFNSAEAKKLLDAAGLSNLALKYAFTTNSSGVDVGRNAVTETVNSMLNAGGIKTTAVQLDFQKDYIDQGKGYRQGYFSKDTVLFGASQVFTEIDDFVFGYFDSKSTQNQEHLTDTAVDGMIAKARTLVDDGARLQAYLDIQRYTAGKMYIVPTGFGYAFRMVQPRVQNFNLGSDNGAVVESYSKVWFSA